MAAIFDQLFQITEEDLLGHSPQLPADFVVPDTEIRVSREVPHVRSTYHYMQAHTADMNKNQAKLAISENKTRNS